MATALHPQTQMTFKFNGQILPAKYGFAMKVHMPTKFGFKNPEHVVALAVLNNYTGSYWEDQVYNWFNGLQAVLPAAAYFDLRARAGVLARL